MWCKRLPNSAISEALTGLEANLRLSEPETMETRIFGRLTAWQNWIFQRPNAVGEKGALKVYGIDGLRVADASILPRVTTGNTQAPCAVIGERAAEILKRAHGL